MKRFTLRFKFDWGWNLIDTTKKNEFNEPYCVDVAMSDDQADEILSLSDAEIAKRYNIA
jgi:hypothetical protein